MYFILRIHRAVTCKLHNATIIVFAATLAYIVYSTRFLSLSDELTLRLQNVGSRVRKSTFIDTRSSCVIS